MFRVDSCPGTRRSASGTPGAGRWAILAAACAVALFGDASAGARAQSLIKVLEQAYRTNPQLEAARASLRSADEEVARARAGFRPQITGTANAGLTRTDNSPVADAMAQTTPRSIGVNLAQPLFRGFRSTNQLKAAEAVVRAQREKLRSTEQAVLLQVATAFMDVVRDQAIVRLRENNVQLLTRQSEAARSELRVATVSRTDVAQAESRRAAGLSALAGARADLEASVSAFEQVVGTLPGRLVPNVPPAHLLPTSRQEARQVAFRENPLVLAAINLEQAARHTVDQIRGEMLPSVTLNSSYNHALEPSLTLDRSRQATVSANLSVPIYSGGEIEARARQARQTRAIRQQEIEQSRAEQVQNATAAWARFAAAKDQVQWAGKQIEAARASLSGVRAEYAHGQRTLLDVLNAEQELLSAEVNEVTARRDSVVHAFALLQAIGRLGARNLALNVELYDPELHYAEVRRKWFGLEVKHADGRMERIEPSHPAR